ncbi:hypothetical protein GGR56DRAFT_370224 [Xylariaceae sp. FL0804]|nr:hypothetical protein GGR56DRAFT_370224 [Xylariaceae sp. FL0804]
MSTASDQLPTVTVPGVLIVYGCGHLFVAQESDAQGKYGKQAAQSLLNLETRQNLFRCRLCSHHNNEANGGGCRVCYRRRNLNADIAAVGHGLHYPTSFQRLAAIAVEAKGIPCRVHFPQGVLLRANQDEEYAEEQGFYCTQYSSFAADMLDADRRRRQYSWLYWEPQLALAADAYVELRGKPRMAPCPGTEGLKPFVRHSDMSLRLSDVRELKLGPRFVGEQVVITPPGEFIVVDVPEASGLRWRNETPDSARALGRVLSPEDESRWFESERLEFERLESERFARLKFERRLEILESERLESDESLESDDSLESDESLESERLEVERLQSEILDGKKKEKLDEWNWW